MNQQREENVTVANAEETSARDEMALRKVARAVLAIARRQLRQEAQEVDDAEG